MRPLWLWRGLVGIVVALNLLSFIVQLDNYLAAWELQDEVLDRLAEEALAMRARLGNT